MLFLRRSRRLAATVVAPTVMSGLFAWPTPAMAEPGSYYLALRRAAATVTVILVASAAVLVGGQANASAKRSLTGAEMISLTRERIALTAGVASAAVTGPFHIQNRHSGKCLTVYNISTLDNAPVVQYQCDFNAPFNEDWYVSGNHIYNAYSAKCLTILSASTANNALAVQYSCDSTAPYNENWSIQWLNSTWTHVVNQHSGKCLTIDQAYTGNNANAVQFTCDTSSPYNEEWSIRLVTH